MEDLVKYDPEGVVMLELWKELDEKTVAEADKVSTPCNQPYLGLILIWMQWRSFPFALGAIDATFEGGVHRFPNVPFFVPYVSLLQTRGGLP